MDNKKVVSKCPDHKDGTLTLYAELNVREDKETAEEGVEWIVAIYCMFNEETHAIYRAVVRYIEIS